MSTGQFKALMAFGALLLILAAVFWLMQRRFPESWSPSRKYEQSFFQRYIAFEAAENGLLVVPFLILGTAGVIVGIGLLLVG